MAVEDDSRAKLVSSIKLLAGADAAGFSEEQLGAYIDVAQAYVSLFKPPEEEADQLTRLWVCHMLAAKLANIGVVKINGVWIEREGDSNPWYDQFVLLLAALGLGKARVFGF